MFLDEIAKEFEELNGIIGNKTPITCLKRMYQSKKMSSEDLLLGSAGIREIIRIEEKVREKKFKASVVKRYSNDYIKLVEKIFDSYDRLVDMFQRDLENVVVQNRIRTEFNDIDTCINRISEIISITGNAEELISEIIEDTWEPLPEDEKKDDINNIIISSETRSMSLNNVASDVGYLDNFLSNICLLINKDKDESNNIYLRRVETGSLTVAISCAMQTAPIIAFIFWCVKLYQKAEKRYLDNSDKKLKLIHENIDMAKEILKVDPDNKEAEEIIQKCGVHMLNFLENNPTGIINGERYDTGAEKLKLEVKEDD